MKLLKDRQIRESAFDPIDLDTDDTLLSALPGERTRSGRWLADYWRVVVVAIAGSGLGVGALLVAAAAGEVRAGLWASGLAFVLTFAAVMTAYLFNRAGSRWGGRAMARAVLESAQVALAVTDLDGKFVQANALYRRLFLGRMPSPLYVTQQPKGKEQLKSALNMAREGLSSEVVVDIVLSGRNRMLSIKSRRHGGFIVWQVEQLDPAATFEEGIRLIRASLGPVLEARGMGLVVLDRAGNVRFLSERAEKVLEIDAGEMSSLTEQDLTGDNGLLEAAKQAGRLLDYRRMDLPVHQDNESLGEALILRGIETGAGEGSGIITELFQNVLNRAPIAIAAVDPEGAFIAYNPAFQELVETLSFSPPGDDCRITDMLQDTDMVEYRDHLDTALRGGPLRHPLEAHIKVGEDDHVVRFYFASGIEGAQTHAFVYMTDSSEQKRLEAQFVQAQKMQAVGQLAGGIAHDFNNLLTAIIGFADLLLLRHGPGDQSFGDLMQIKQNANRAANLVRQLLAFSRRQTLRPKVINVTDTLQELSNLIHRLTGERITLNMVHAKRLGRVKVDEGQFEQVIINLAVNARDAMPEGGKLSIRTANVTPADIRSMDEQLMPEGHYVRITIEDTGTGIPASYLDKVFEPFFTTKEVGKGTGLGLATVYGIVKQTGGFIYVDSEPDKGARFDIYVPAYRNGEETAAQRKSNQKDLPPKDLTGKGTILVVEDEDPVRSFTVRALANKGYNMLEADSGEAALDILEKGDEQIDLMISDVVMPSLDGPTLVSRARELNPGLKIIMISGYAEDAFRKKISVEQIAFLPKPFSLTHLAEKVKEALES